MEHWTEKVFEEKPELFLPELEEREEEAEEQVEKILELLSEKYNLKPQNVLDVACGIGRHVIEFARKGVQAQGFDISEEYINYAKKKAEEETLSDRTKFFKLDMRDVDKLGGKYDLIINFYTSFGFYNRETNRNILNRLRNLLSEEGILLIDIINKDNLLTRFEEEGLSESEGFMRMEKREFDVETSRMKSNLDIFKKLEEGYKWEGEMNFDHRIYSPVELKEILEGVGFSKVDVFGSLDGEEINLDSKRMIVLGTK